MTRQPEPTTHEAAPQEAAFDLKEQCEDLQRTLLGACR